MASIPKIYSPREIISLNPSRSTDQMMVSLLRTYRSVLPDELSSCSQDLMYELSLCSQHLMSLIRVIGSANSALEGDLAGVRPDQLPSWFFISHPSVAMEGWKTDHGNWLPKRLVSIPNTFQGNSPDFPKLGGAKATLEFKPTDGSKAVFGMTRYNMLTVGKYSDGLYLDEELSLCHVYPLGGKGKGVRNRNGKRRRSGSAADQCNDFAPPPFGDLEQEISEFDFTEFSPLDVDDYGVDVPDLPSSDSSKHPRLESKHWHNFTKIYTKNPELMYAACNHCDTMLKLKGGSSCGTGSLRHHNDSCRCKPKQEQLPGNSSSMPIPSIAL